ncbi:glutamate--tRNA ligase [Thiotrichales bacterium 19S3-7]|nr:glutamate--tRNA ligase [Thiotrichales bacterium 19S3-7]MCF6801956.1 glutamate--tRNA ligase [Thiotrichales bacterium 19S3-11]
MKTRFAPSPTGLITTGNARTALFSALLAKKDHDIFLLRIEDTDSERSKSEYCEQLQKDLKWLKCQWQEGPGEDLGNGPYLQSQRNQVYEDFYQKLIDSKLAYPCFCSEEKLELTRKVQRASGQAPRYPGTCRHLSNDEAQAKLAEGLKPALRFRVPQGAVVEFEDVVKGNQKFNADDIGDFIIRKNDQSPSFMFCNAIDDALMAVTHVLRGEDHLTNTPRQLMILDALGLNKPQYAHISLITGADAKPLSKRNGSRSLEELQALGYLPEAVINYLARLGHYYEENDLMSFDQLAEKFSLQRLGSSAARYDENQLNYWQKEAVLNLDNEILWQWLGDEVQIKVPQAKQDAFMQIVRDNVIFPKDALDYCNILFSEDNLTYSEDALTILSEAGSEFFDAALAISKNQFSWSEVTSHIKNTQGVKGKKLFQPLRVAISGMTHGPQMSEFCALMSDQLIRLRLLDARSKVSN